MFFKPYYPIILLTGFLFANIPLISYAQGDGYHFWHLKPEDRLHSETNLSIAKGPDGYIWLTSGSRLQRYDGIEFTTYFFEPDSLLDTQIKAFQIHLVDRNNHVWVSMDTAMYQFIPETKVWKHYTISPHIPGRLNALGSFYSTKMLQDQQGNIWLVSGSYGLLVADEARSSFKSAPAKNSIQPAYCTGLVEDKEGFFWFTSKNLLCRYDPRKGVFWHAGYNPENHPAIGLRGQAVFIDSRDRIWLSGWKETCPQLIRIDRKTGHIKTFPYYSISCFAEDRLGRVWLGRYYDKNLYCFDPKTEDIRMYPSIWWKSNTLHADEHIAQLMMDEQENLWVMDWYNLNVFRPARQQVFTFSHDPSKTGLRLPYHEVNSFLQASDGTVYVSYWHDKGGVAVLDSNMNLQKVWGWGDTSVIFPRHCWTILEDHLGKIWINQQNNYLTIYDPKTGKSQKLNPPEFQGSSPYCAIRDSKDDFWFGLWSQKGLVHWNSMEQKFYHYPIRSNKSWNIIKVILEDRNGRDLWLGTEWGLFLFDKQKKLLRGQYRVLEGKSEDNPFTINDINYLNDSTLVLGTTEGLFTFDVRRKKRKTFVNK
ncbi:MAG: hypothetical protein SH848_10405 [Saprospiraceae bacterium]|nr:hypothetical protein [Saprospiraceae bacterium]